MQHYVGLDVSVKGTSVCIVDKAGKVIREVKIATEPVAILAVLTEEALARTIRTWPRSSNPC
jgi:transposase